MPFWAEYKYMTTQEKPDSFAIHIHVYLRLCGNFEPRQRVFRSLYQRN